MHWKGKKPGQGDVAAGPLNEAGKTNAKEKQEKRLLQPAGCRSYIRKRLANEFVEIVDGFVEEAKKGSCPHLKMATELLKPTRKGTTRKKGAGAKLFEEFLGDL